MTIGTIDESQRKAATVVGFSYLFALPPAIFAEFYVRTRLIAFDNAAQTAQNIMAHERLFRLGTASNLTVFALDVVLIIALYVVLTPVNRRLALLATGWGLIETATLVFVTLSDFDVLRILSGADYLHAFEANRLQALARLSVSAHADAYNVGMHDPAAFHHEDAVGDIENEAQHLLADDDTKIADTADVAQQPRNILDDRRLDALGRLVQ